MMVMMVAAMKMTIVMILTTTTTMTIMTALKITPTKTMSIMMLMPTMTTMTKTTTMMMMMMMMMMMITWQGQYTPLRPSFQSTPPPCICHGNVLCSHIYHAIHIVLIHSIVHQILRNKYYEYISHICLITAALLLLNFKD